MIRYVSDEDYVDLRDVETSFTQAAEIVEVEDGWMVFDTVDEAETWRNQQ